MSSSEQGFPDSPSVPAHEQQPVRHGRFGTWLPVVIVAVVVVALVAVLLVRAGVMTGNGPKGSTGAGSTIVVPANWQTFHDPLGLYTLRFPPGWTAQGGFGPEGAVGANFGSETLTEEGFHFTDPSQGTGSAEVFILTNPIKTAFDHQWFCQGHSQEEHATFHSFPALYLGNQASWIFETGNAHFQFDVTIPGVEGSLDPGGPFILPTATPLPATWVATDQVDVGEILASFQPTDLKPLSC